MKLTILDFQRTDMSGMYSGSRFVAALATANCSSDGRKAIFYFSFVVVFIDTVIPLSTANNE